VSSRSRIVQVEASMLPIGQVPVMQVAHSTIFRMSIGKRILVLKVWGEGSSVGTLPSDERASRWCCSYSSNATGTNDSSAATVTSSTVTGVSAEGGK